VAFSYPISAEIKQFANQYHRFADSLKMLNDSDYVTLNTIILSYPPTLPNGSQVIGVFYANIKSIHANKGVLFKQDYIVKSPDGEFTSYTATKSPNKQVRPLSEFLQTIARGGLYGTDNGKKLDHHYFEVNRLPEELREEAAELIQKYGAISEKTD
jgi:hypothetical protein